MFALDGEDEHTGEYNPTDTFAYWNGVDKKGRPCCYLLGRNFDPSLHRRHRKAFKRFVLEMVENGCLLAKSINAESIGIIYDRRQLSWNNIDTHILRVMMDWLKELRDYYSGWVAVVYIIDVNTLQLKF